MCPITESRSRWIIHHESFSADEELYTLVEQASATMHSLAISRALLTERIGNLERAVSPKRPAAKIESSHANCNRVGWKVQCDRAP